MTTYHYETESHMRANHPWIANHLATIANEQDGIMTAQLDGVTYSWGNVKHIHHYQRERKGETQEGGES
jgi:hypothetical protein